MSARRIPFRFSLWTLLTFLTIVAVVTGWPRWRRQQQLAALANVSEMESARQMLDRLAPAAIPASDTIEAVIATGRGQVAVVSQGTGFSRLLVIDLSGFHRWAGAMRLRANGVELHRLQGWPCLKLAGEVSSAYLCLRRREIVEVRYEVLDQVTTRYRDDIPDGWLAYLASPQIVDNLRAMNAIPNSLAPAEQEALDQRLAELQHSPHPWVRQAARAAQRQYVDPAFISFGGINDSKGRRSPTSK